MATKQVTVWYDAEADYLEVIWEIKAGHFRQPADDRVMERVDVEGNVLGFSILGLSTIKGAPLAVSFPQG